MRSSVDKGAGGCELFVAECTVLAFPRGDDIAEAARCESAACCVGEPGGYVLLVNLGGFTDGEGELRFDRDGESFDTHALIILRHTLVLHIADQDPALQSTHGGPDGPCKARAEGETDADAGAVASFCVAPDDLAVVDEHPPSCNDGDAIHPGTPPLSPDLDSVLDCPPAVVLAANVVQADSNPVITECMKFGTLVRLVNLLKGTQENAVEDGRIYRLLGGLGLMLGAVAGTRD